MKITINEAKIPVSWLNGPTITRIETQIKRIIANSEWALGVVARMKADMASITSDIERLGKLNPNFAFNASMAGIVPRIHTLDTRFSLQASNYGNKYSPAELKQLKTEITNMVGKYKDVDYTKVEADGWSFRINYGDLNLSESLKAVPTFEAFEKSQTK